MQDGMVVPDASGLFVGLPADELAELRQRLQRRLYAPGQVLLHQGRHSGALHVIHSGAVRVTAHDTLGNVTDLALLGPGQVLGEMSVLTGEAHSATVTALEPTETDVLSRDDFLALLGRSARLARNISQTLSERLLRTSRRQLEAERAVITAVTCPSLPQAAPVIGLNLALSLVRQTRRRTLLVVDAATLAGALAPFAPRALPPLVLLTRDERVAGLHRSPPPGHPALAGVELCATGPGEAVAAPATVVAALEQLTNVYRHIVLAPANGGEYAAQLGASRVLLVGPPARLHDEGMEYVRVAAREAGATPDAVITDVAEQPTTAERHRLGDNRGRPLLHAIPMALELLARDPLPPLIRRERHGAVAQAIDWLARDIARLKVGLALGAGSARGFAHIGVLRVLERAGVPFDVVTGTSVGAIVAGFWSCGFGTEWIAQALSAASRGLLRPTVPYASLFSSRSVRAALRHTMGDRRIEDLRHPFAAVAVDLATREPVALRRGPLWHAALASAAIPGIYPPVLHEGRLLIDGVIRDPLPLGVAADLGADVLIGVRLSPFKDGTGVAAPGRVNILDVVFTMLDVMQETIESHGSQQAGLVIHPRVGKVTLREFSAGEPLIEAGEIAATEALPGLRRYLPWLEGG